MKVKTKRIYLTPHNKYFATIDAEDYELVRGYSWNLSHKEGQAYYALTRIGLGGRKQHSIGMHRMIMGEKKGKQVDHIDGDGLNNRRSNLRFCTETQNKGNTKKSLRNTSGYKGVQRRGNSWIVFITRNHKPHYLGSFKDPIEAAKAYDKAAVEKWGEFARGNFTKNRA